VTNSFRFGSDATFYTGDALIIETIWINGGGAIHTKG